ncbi:G protein-coupled receptor 161-like [Clytia hemisphaerica]|uniref:G-protein coupled receptors family 1 profile domain-containing protein n=1 Tax=Clytia hemisphaerica TaxID=252671 RepID=A0A7M5UZX0_9CNID|eukprot:TCONS_00069412-protein
MVNYLNIPAIVTILVVLAVIATFLNSLSIYIIVTTRHLWKRNSSLLLMNLLVVHLFQGVFVFPFYAGKKVKQDFLPAQIFGNGFRLSYMLSFYGACLGILLIAIDRFLATYLLTKYKTIVTRKRVKITLAVFWIYIIGLCMIPFIDTSGPQMKTKFDNSTNQTIEYEAKKFYVYNQQRVWVLFMLIVNTALPYVLVVMCYSFIAYRLKSLQIYHPTNIGQPVKKSKYAVNKTNETDELKPLRKKDVEKHKQVTKLTFILTLAYGVFWTPSIIYYPLKADCKSCFPENYEDSELEQYVGFITKYLAFLDAAVAPLVYCFMHREFQKSLIRIKSKLLKLPLPEPDVPSTSNDTTLLQ